jgi:hypothetical protein
VKLFPQNSQMRCIRMFELISVFVILKLAV